MRPSVVSRSTPKIAFLDAGRILAVASALILTLISALPASVQGGTGRVVGIVVVAETREPLAGAWVRLEGTHRDAVTNETGRFVIDNVSPGSYNLVASYSGYANALRENVRVVAGAAVLLEIEMTGMPLAIDGVVATGVIEPTSGARVPFSVGRVTAGAVPILANTSAAAAIQGRVAGAQVIRSHAPGGGVRVQLRSPTSIFGSNGPLYMVDGVILSNTGERTTVDIESLDIERVEVIKGTAAMALYGSRAGNGVVAIYTGRGSGVQPGSTRITAKSEFGVSRLGSRVPTANRSHYFLTDDEGRFIDLGGNVLADPFAGRVTAPDRIMDNPWGPYRRYDHFDTFFDSGQFRGSTFSISHNSGHLNYTASFSNYLTEGVVRGNEGFERNSGRLNVDIRPLSNLSLHLSGYRMHSSRDDLVGAPIEDMLRFSPDVDLGAAGLNGEPYRIEPAAPLLGIRNPLYWQAVNENQEKRERTLAAAAARFTPTNWLALSADIGYDISDRQIEEYRPKGTTLSETAPDGDDPDVEGGINGRYRIYLDRGTSYTAAFTASLFKSFGPLATRAFYRGTRERSETEFLDQVGTQFSFTGVKDIAAAQDRRMASGTSHWRANAHIVGALVDYDDRYMADLMFRLEGVALHEAEKELHHTNYYRAAVNWRVSREPWFDLPGVTELQLRFSHGTARDGSRRGFMSGADGSAVPRLLPEKTTENDFMVRTVFADRISLDLSYITSRTIDQSMMVPVPGPYGTETARRNAGTIDGNTLEATIEARLAGSGRFAWWTRVVLDRSRHEIVEFDRPCYRENMTFYCVGQSLGEFSTTRLHRSPEELRYRHDAEVLEQFDVNDDGLLVWVGEGNSYRDGIAKDLWGTTATIDGFTYEWGLPFQETDVLGNPIRSRTGDANPDLNFGWGNSLRFGNLSLHAQVHGQIGGDIYNTTKARMYNRWRHGDVDQAGKPDELKKPIDYYRAIYNSGNFTDFFIEDGTYAKLSELSVRYDFQPNQLRFLDRLGVSGLSVGVIGRNLYTLTNYSGFDPEVGSIFNRRDVNDHPSYRTISGEVRVSF